MQHIDFYLDFLSPYSYLAFEQLPVVLEGHSYSVQYRPVFLGALLRQRGLKGPAEIPGKREWIYRQVLWQARQLGLPMQMPAAHPFDALPLLRLALAHAGDGNCNRFVAASLLRHVWQGGADALAPARLATLAQNLGPGALDAQGDAVKQLLRTHTEQAAAQGVFGVPSLVVQGRVFWGYDALPMLRAYLGGDPWFDGPDWHGMDGLPSAIRADQAG